MSKDQDLKYIKGFSKISISGVCKELGINRMNVLNGNASAKNIKDVKNRIEEKIKELGE